MEREILELFKVMVVAENYRHEGKANTDNVSRGIITDFKPTAVQLRVLNEFYKPLNVRTLFSKQERDNVDSLQLITKQILHYVEVYGLDSPGLFDLEVSEGTVVPMTFVRGVTKNEFDGMVRELLYANAPVKDSVALKRIINWLNVDYNINLVADNEMKIALFNPSKDRLNNGDDVVRYMCYAATGKPLLIKSRDAIQAVASINWSRKFLENHVIPLAQVFNRHKRLIMAAKNNGTKDIINRISRLSKIKHVPIREGINKTFVSRSLNDPALPTFVLEKISVRDHFKYLNLLAHKKQRVDSDTFVIRNGKVFVKTDRPLYAARDIARVEKTVLKSLKERLSYLASQKILLDSNVEYGLPVSRKQTVGQLPFGTRVNVHEGKISAGMYWENSWGARDLDLSTIDEHGQRTGWGQYSGYDRYNSVTFSGDVTDAILGAMEFMTSQGETYGLFVNIYAGELGSEMELVVGSSTKDRWITNPLIRERHTLNSRGSIIGFVRDNALVVYSGRLSNGRMSGPGNRAVVSRGLSDFWTVNRLFDVLDIEYDLDKNAKTSYNHELGYEEFSYDKLENMLLNS